jgi:hypothetical protein
MKTYEIYWDDLTEEAKERLKDLEHGNYDVTPMAIIEIEENLED